LYRAYGLDADAIVAAAARLCVKMALGGPAPSRPDPVAITITLTKERVW
jgi:hypothetical protein